jgi:hypothetical protein
VHSVWGVYLSVSENGELRKTCGSKREVEEAVGRRKLHDEDLHNLCSLPNINSSDEVQEN